MTEILMGIISGNDIKSMYKKKKSEYEYLSVKKGEEDADIEDGEPLSPSMRLLNELDEAFDREFSKDDSGIELDEDDTPEDCTEEFDEEEEEEVELEEVDSEEEVSVKKSKGKKKSKKNNDSELVSYEEDEDYNTLGEEWDD